MVESAMVGSAVFTNDPAPPEKVSFQLTDQLLKDFMLIVESHCLRCQLRVA